MTLPSPPEPVNPLDNEGRLRCPNCTRGVLGKPEFGHGSITLACPKCRQLVKIEAKLVYSVSVVASTDEVALEK